MSAVGGGPRSACQAPTGLRPPPSAITHLPSPTLQRARLTFPSYAEIPGDDRRSCGIRRLPLHTGQRSGSHRDGRNPPIVSRGVPDAGRSPPGRVPGLAGEADRSYQSPRNRYLYRPLLPVHGQRPAGKRSDHLLRHLRGVHRPGSASVGRGGGGRSDHPVAGPGSGDPGRPARALRPGFS